MFAKSLEALKLYTVQILWHHSGWLNCLVCLKDTAHHQSVCKFIYLFIHVEH